MKKNTVTRTDLLTVHLHDKQSLSKVEIKKIMIPQMGKRIIIFITAQSWVMSFQELYYFKWKGNVHI